MVNVLACSAVRDKATWKLTSSTSGEWLENVGEEKWWFGATLFDKDGELCYTYQRMATLPKVRYASFYVTLNFNLFSMF
jgi:hypothetical protein